MTTEETAGQFAPGQYVHPLWSVEIPPGRLVLDARGGWLVASRNWLASFGPDSALRWRVEAVSDVPELPVCTPDGAVIRVEGDAVVTRGDDSGEVVASFPAPGAARLTVPAWGGLVYSQFNPDGNATLRATSLDGEHRWSVPLRERGHPLYPPLPLQDTVVVHDGGRLRALDRDGRVRWVAGHGGFQDPGLGPGTSGRDADELWTEPMPAGAATVLVGLRWWTGAELYLIGATSRTVRPYVPAAMASNPITVVRSVDHGLRVAAQGPRYEVRQMDYRWPVVMLDESGSRLWEHPLEVQPVDLCAGAGGSVIVSATPSRHRWEAYGRWQDLSKDVFVMCLGPNGDLRWTWYAPGPLSNLPKVARDGVVYVGSEGRLWALPPA